MLRKAAVAGQFYPEEEDTLLDELNELIPKTEEKVDCIGAVVPHAGYMYSGSVAGKVFSRINAASTFVILSPNHTGNGPRFSLSTDDWQTPLGVAKSDTELAEVILNSSNVIQEDQLAHAFEHSVEVQLPFIKKLFPDAHVVPITVSHGGLDELRNVAEVINSASKELARDITVIASSDMSHYESRESASRKDKLAISKLLDMDAKGLLEVVSREHITMCGSTPAAIMIMYAKLAEAQKAELIEYTDSGRVTGTIDEVVGYAGVIIS